MKTLEGSLNVKSVNAPPHLLTSGSVTSKLSTLLHTISPGVRSIEFPSNTSYQLLDDLTWIDNEIDNRQYLKKRSGAESWFRDSGMLKIREILYGKYKKDQGQIK
ncbi:hypothetical protein BpHYR1_000742 [Brachionus plicatilis]|uniref:Uncharacterized protein n=1 Tax=Brachionus plicatilis TaxID=10195 RepID=A0A3M7S304_BRAPC|nr:hypothetical protein BpHYR1_000742 [Brachionus plicatilis]